MTDIDLDSLLARDHEPRPLDDARSEFYFANRESIETWASLRTDASAQLAQRLLDLAEQLEADLADLGESNVVIQGVSSGAHGRLEATRESWDPSEVSLCIEWEAKPLNSKGDVRVYACVRQPTAPPRGIEDVARLTDSLRPVMPGWSSSRPRWPVWRYVKPSPVTLPSILNEARRDFLHLWVGTSHLIDAWVQEGNAVSHAAE